MIELGDEIKDTVTGFKGIAVAKTDWLNGCTRWTIQPSVDKEGKVPPAECFDETQLVLVKRKKVAQGRHDTGGPIPVPRQQPMTGR